MRDKSIINFPCLRLLLALGVLCTAGHAAAAPARLAPLDPEPPEALRADGFPRRLVAIDNVCAWPNLVTLRDGSLVAVVFNQPNHAHTEGDIDAWGSADGRFWQRLSTITKHEPQTVRMNHAAGLNAAGELVVLCNGWDKIAPRRSGESRPLQTIVSISRDGGRTWRQGGPVLPRAPGLSWHVPFGDIQLAANGDLVAGTYAFQVPYASEDGKRRGSVFAVRSQDGGNTWTHIAPIAQDTHVEAAILHTGGGRWLAASRRFGHLDLDLFASDDDAFTWRHVTTLDVKPVSSAHLLKLSDGRILLTYGNRTPGDYGIDARVSGDAGRTWGAPQRLAPLDTRDLGYPDAVELPGGRVLVSYYSAGVAAHQRYHMGVLYLTLDELPSPLAPAPAYTLELMEMLPPSAEGGEWFQPRPAAIPAPMDPPRVVMTIQKAMGSDFFSGLSTLETRNLGRTWTKPVANPGLGWRAGENGLQIGICDITLGWHEPSQRVIGIGHTARYTATGFAGFGHRRDTVWTVFDPKTDEWTPWRILEFPPTPDDRYFFNGVHGQWLVEPDGSLLVPFYFVGPKQGFLLRGAVARLRFDGRTLAYLGHGDELIHPVPRGLYEKSLTWFGGRYYLTMRNDQAGYVAVSDDGLNFGPVRSWTFDDGTDLGSYNTQQKWVTHGDGLFLVYTRRGANNDHIIRHRAPLFIAQVDPERLHVLRETERIAVPERGASLGNFDATTINADETWITVAGGPAYLTRIRWSVPNRLAGRVN